MNFDWGGNKVDVLCCIFVMDIVGDNVMKVFIINYEFDFYCFLNNLEGMKRVIYFDKIDKIIIVILIFLLEIYLEMNLECNISIRILFLLKYKNKFIWKGDKI